MPLAAHQGQQRDVRGGAGRPVQRALDGVQPDAGDGVGDRDAVGRVGARGQGVVRGLQQGVRESRRLER
ncbi:hypothetical protein AB0E62_01925 [Streptomyces sp. NPDC038707]|uniref:hypothetical protein n=1 Tax=unclassified Streptomyces TaxID=2593676 RepID=UPI0033EA0E77